MHIRKHIFIILSLTLMIAVSNITFADDMDAFRETINAMFENNNTDSDSISSFGDTFTGNTFTQTEQSDRTFHDLQTGGEQNVEFSSFLETALSDNNMSFSEAFNAYSEDFMLDTSKLYEGVNANADFGIVNLKYEEALGNMQNFQAGFLSPTDRMESVISLFSETYGDLVGSIDMSGYKIPESLNASESAKVLGNSFREAYGANEYVSSVASSIDISSIFELASENLSMPDLRSTDSLSALIFDANATLQASSQSSLSEATSFMQSMSNAGTLYDNISSIIAYNDELQSLLGTD